MDKDRFTFDIDAISSFCRERAGASPSQLAQYGYRRANDFIESLPRHGDADLRTAIGLVHCMDMTGREEEALDDFGPGLFLRRHAIGLVLYVRDDLMDGPDLRLLEASLLCAYGFSLQQFDRWDEALEVHAEVAELISDGVDGSESAINLMALAHDSIGDLQDILGASKTRDEAWERARILYQSLLHSVDAETDDDAQRRDFIVSRLQDVIDKLAEARDRGPGA